MPASNRLRTMVAAIAACLLIMAVPGSGTASAPVTARAAAPARSPVTVEVASGGTTAPVYRIEVRNGSGTTLDATVRQELPEGAAPTAVSGGGQVTNPGGQVKGLEVNWRLQLAAGDAATMSTTLNPPVPGSDVTAPACVFPGDGTVPFDCATASWSAPPVVVEAAPPWWQRTPVIAAGLTILAFLVLAAVGWRWRARRRRAATRSVDQAAAATGNGGGRATPGGTTTPGGTPAADSTSGNGGFEAGTGKTDRAPSRPAQGGGGIYLGGQPGGPKLIGDEPPVPRADDGVAGGPIEAPRSAGGPQSPPTQRNRRTGPPVWLLVGLAAATLVTAITVVTWTASTRVAAVNANRQPSDGAWVGDTAVGPVGAALRDSTFEFIVYRITCPPDTGRCEATVGLQNVSGHDQPWHGAMQRAYLPDGDWVSVDETATLAANAGRDLFAEPVPAGQRRLVPLIFTMPGADAPTRIELRGDVFSAGVSVDIP